MYTFFLVVHAIVATAMVGVILMQRSEGGGLAGGGNPAGLMSARGAADFLTRTTTILATLFVVLSIALAAIAITNRTPGELDTSLARKPVNAPAAPTSSVPMAGVPTLPAVDPSSGTSTQPKIDEAKPSEKTDIKVDKTKAEPKGEKPTARDVIAAPLAKPASEKSAAPATEAPAPAPTDGAAPK